MYVNTVVQKTNILLLNILYPIVYWDLIDEMKEVMLLHKKTVSVVLLLISFYLLKHYSLLFVF